MAEETYSILLVDADDGFVDDTKGLLNEHTVYTARNMSDGQRRLVEEGIQIAVLGPTFGAADSVRDVRMLFELRPALPVILATDELTTDVLRTAMRLGVKDVIEMPLRDRAGRGQDRQCDAEVEAAALLRLVSGREIDRDAAAREVEVTVLDGALDTIPGFTDGRLRQADNGEGWQPGAEVCLDRHCRRLDTVLRAGVDAREPVTAQVPALSSSSWTRASSSLMRS